MADEVRIEVGELTGSRVHQIDGFESYSIPCDLMRPGSSFTFNFAPSRALVALFRSPGQIVRCYVDGALQFTGIVESVPFSSESDGLKCSISGRDMGGLLVDALPVLLTFGKQTLEQIATILTEPMRDFIPGVIVSNDLNRNTITGRTGGRQNKGFTGVTAEKKTLHRTRVEDRVWDILVSLAQEQGAHVWISARGEVVISRPDYSQASIYGAGLYERWDMTADPPKMLDANCRIRHAPSIANRASHYITLGQGQPAASTTGATLTNIKHAVYDPSPAFWVRESPGLPHVNRLEKIRHQSVRNIENAAHVRRTARQRMQVLAAQGYAMTAIVPGHHAYEGGPLWAVDTQVNARYDLRGIDDLHYIVGRTFSYDPGQGKTTELTLYPTGLWLAANDPDESDDAFNARMRRAVVC